MSLEAAIRELNENVITLTKALGARPTPEAAPAKAPAGPVTPPAKPVEAAKVALNYDKDVKPAALKLLGAKNGRERMIEVLKKHGATTAQALKPEQYVAFVKDISAELAR